jgi:hypothetical protein
MFFASWMTDRFEGMVLFLLLGGAAFIYMMKKLGMGGVAKSAAQTGIASWIVRMFK